MTVVEGGRHSWVVSAGSLGGILLLWEVLGAIGVYDESLLPRPTSVAIALWQMAVEGLLVRDLASTALRVFVGFLIGSSGGCLVGLLTGIVPLARRIVEPVVQVARPIPAVALVPLAIVWFGVGELGKFLIVAWASFFPVWVNTHLGVQRVPRELLWTAAVLGAEQHIIIADVILPWSLPFVQAGMRVALGLSFAATVVAEMSGASAGLGFRIFTSHLLFRVDRMVAAILLVGAFGAVIDRGFIAMTRWVFPWLDVVGDKT